MYKRQVTARVVNVLDPEPVMFPLTLPVTAPVCVPVESPVKGPTKLVPVTVVPVIAAGVEPPITVPSMVPPVTEAEAVTREPLAVTVPEAVIAPVVIDDGLVPSSKMFAEPSSVNNRLSAKLTASWPSIKSEEDGTAEAVEDFFMLTLIDIWIPPRKKEGGASPPKSPGVTRSRLD